MPAPDPAARLLEIIANSLTPAERRPVNLANERELADWILDVLGIQVPHTRVCADHCSPLEALADAYFAAHSRSVWFASRGFGGKSVLLSSLVMAESITLGAGVTLLGGSLKQSQNVHDYMKGRGNLQGRFFAWPRAPRQLIIGEPTAHKTNLANGGWIEALPASSRAVRGPHPQRLRGDELDEMDPEVWDGACGQPVSRGVVESQIVASSTLQYADGSMARELKMAAERGWPIFTWCYRETMAKGGFITLEEVARKKAQMTEESFRVEVELGEPAIENRAINASAVDRMFDSRRGKHPGELGTRIEIEPPEPEARYATGCDWGKARDKTIIWTIRCDLRPARLVAFSHIARIDWNIIASAFNRQVGRYPGHAMYDKTGLGTVLEDLVAVRAEGLTMVGLERTNLFQNWVAAIERGDCLAPRIEYAYREHKFCRNEDLFGGGHPPDTLVAAALAWKAASKPPFEVL